MWQEQMIIECSFPNNTWTKTSVHLRLREQGRREEGTEELLKTQKFTVNFLPSLPKEDKSWKRVGNRVCIWGDTWEGKTEYEHTYYIAWNSKGIDKML